MGMRHRLVVAGLLVIASVPAARAQEEAPKPPPAAPDPEAVARKEAKVRRYLEVSRWDDRMLDGLAVMVRMSEKLKALPRGYTDRLLEVCDRKALLDAGVAAYTDVLDDATLDAAIAFYESPEGRKAVAAAPGAAGRAEKAIRKWFMGASQAAMKSMMERPPPRQEGEAEEEDDPMGLLGNLKRAKMSANETAAIATLRNLTSCQAQIECSGKIDCDNDGIGEYGTFLELTGSTPVRKGFREFKGSERIGNSGASDFSQTGSRVKPAILSPVLAGVDENGVVRKNGYCYRIYLPDTANPAGFVHETGPKEKVGLAGGTKEICVDLSETTWCAYAWPEKWGDSGKRAFFVCQSGDILKSSNEKAKWAGLDKPVPPETAFTGAGITGESAVGTLGRDGEVWEVVN